MRRMFISIVCACLCLMLSCFHVNALDVNGKIKSERLKEGAYKITEVKVGKGYLINTGDN